MTPVEPQTFELAIDAAGSAGPGAGLLAAFVPAAAGQPPVMVLGCDPRHDPDRPVEALAPAAIGWLRARLGAAADGAVWATIDNYGRFSEAVPDFGKLGAGGAAPAVEFCRFASGIGIDAFYRDVGPAGEAAIELLSAVLEAPSQDPATPPMAEFLDALEAHGSLPAPGMIFRKVALAAEEGDAREIADAIQPDPVISAALINYANAARFVAAGKTASVPQAVTRLGTSFVKRVVFVAEMMVRYRRGACPGFDYRGFWLNALATGAALRALLPAHGLPEKLADDAFTAGLVAGIGWLAVAETYPALMERYLERGRHADPLTRARLQREVFPCEISRVSERYLQRFEFPETVIAAVAGRGDGRWGEALAQAIRVAQALAPFACLAVPASAAVPDACRDEWRRWQPFVSSVGG